MSQKLPSLRGLINPKVTFTQKVGQKQSHWFAVKSYSPNSQPPHRNLAPQLPRKWTKLSKAAFRVKYQYRKIPPVWGLWREGKRGLMGRDERSWNTRIWCPCCLALPHSGTPDRGIKETAEDSDTRNTFMLLFPGHLCLQKVTTVDKLVPTKVKGFPSPLLTCHSPKLYLLPINKCRQVSTWEAAKPHASAFGNERNAVLQVPRAEDPM